MSDSSRSRRCRACLHRGPLWGFQLVIKRGIISFVSAHSPMDHRWRSCRRTHFRSRNNMQGRRVGIGYLPWHLGDRDPFARPHTALTVSGRWSAVATVTPTTLNVAPAPDGPTPSTGTAGSPRGRTAHTTMARRATFFTLHARARDKPRSAASLRTSRTKGTRPNLSSDSVSGRPHQRRCFEASHFHCANLVANSACGRWERHGA